MPLLRLRVYWEEDDLTYRDIEILSTHTFNEFHKGILEAYEFEKNGTALFFESDDQWKKHRVFSTEVKTNKKEADVLSMEKTPVLALIASPNQKFIYEYTLGKTWFFMVELIGIENSYNDNITYPRTSRKEGMSPAQFKYGGGMGLMIEIEEKYDLSSDRLEDDFSEDSSNSDEDDYNEEYNNTNDSY